MAEATRNLKFLPRCNGGSSRDGTGRDAIPTGQPICCRRSRLDLAQSGQLFQFQYAISRSSGVANASTVHWSLPPTGSSLKNYCLSQILNNRRKLSGIYNLTEVRFGLCRASQP